MQAYRDVCECVCGFDCITQKQKEYLIRSAEGSLTPKEKGLELKTMVFNVNRLSKMLTNLADMFDVKKVIH
jgi:hypothetical protein